MKTIFILLIIVTGLCSAQTDWVKWEAKTVSYEIKTEKDSETAVPVVDTDIKILSTARKVYGLMFSDLDGDNCPFYPSCSQFYVDAVKETDLLKGTLMFVDRFTRDVNFFKGLNRYPVYKNNKFFDPAYNYCLNPQKINLQPNFSPVN